MNYLLSVYANRVTGCNCARLYAEGRVIRDYSCKFSGDNIKENVLSCLHRGLRMCQSYLRHDDHLYIEIQNVHLTDWLMGRKENKDYNESLDVVFADVELLDCQYKYIFEKSPRAKKATEQGVTGGAETVKTVGVDDLMSELEG